MEPGHSASDAIDGTVSAASNTAENAMRKGKLKTWREEIGKRIGAYLSDPCDIVSFKTGCEGNRGDPELLDRADVR